MFFLQSEKAKTNYKWDYTSNHFLKRIGDQINRLISVIFQIGLEHEHLAGTWAITQQK